MDKKAKNSNNSNLSGLSHSGGSPNTPQKCPPGAQHALNPTAKPHVQPNTPRSLGMSELPASHTPSVSTGYPPYQSNIQHAGYPQPQPNLQPVHGYEFPLNFGGISGHNPFLPNGHLEPQFTTLRTLDTPFGPITFMPPIPMPFVVPIPPQPFPTSGYYQYPPNIPSTGNMGGPNQQHIDGPVPNPTAFEPHHNIHPPMHGIQSQGYQHQAQGHQQQNQGHCYPVQTGTMMQGGIPMPNLPVHVPQAIMAQQQLQTQFGNQTHNIPSDQTMRPAHPQASSPHKDSGGNKTELDDDDSSACVTGSSSVTVGNTPMTGAAVDPVVRNFHVHFIPPGPEQHYAFPVDMPKNFDAYLFPGAHNPGDHNAQPFPGAHNPGDHNAQSFPGIQRPEGHNAPSFPGIHAPEGHNVLPCPGIQRPEGHNALPLPGIHMPEGNKALPCPGIHKTEGHKILPCPGIHKEEGHNILPCPGIHGPEDRNAQPIETSDAPSAAPDEYDRTFPDDVDESKLTEIQKHQLLQQRAWNETITIARRVARQKMNSRYSQLNQPNQPLQPRSDRWWKDDWGDDQVFWDKDLI